MLDNALYFTGKAEENINKSWMNWILKDKDFILCTLHRDNNTDSAERLNAIMGTLNEISREQANRICIAIASPD